MIGHILSFLSSLSPLQTFGKQPKITSPKDLDLAYLPSLVFCVLSLPSFPPLAHGLDDVPSSHSLF